MNKIISSKDGYKTPTCNIEFWGFPQKLSMIENQGIDGEFYHSARKRSEIWKQSCHCMPNIHKLLLNCTLWSEKPVWENFEYGYSWNKDPWTKMIRGFAQKKIQTSRRKAKLKKSFVHVQVFKMSLKQIHKA